MQIRSIRKVVTTAGTRVQLTTSDIIAAWVNLSVDKGSTGECVIGDNTVVAANGSQVGTPLSTANGERRGIQIEGPISLASIWLDTQVNGSAVTGSYLPIKE